MRAPKQEPKIAGGGGDPARVFSGYHESVLPGEVVEALRPGEGKLYIDGTLGGGGHASLLLEAGASVIGFDQDEEALEEAGKKLEKYGERFRSVRTNFRAAGEVLEGLGVSDVDGVLLDVGVSSRQLDAGGRGFSFRENGPLDMRMDRRSPVTAESVVNGETQERLSEIFREYGEEPMAAKVAARIVQVREGRRLETTFDLAEAVGSVIPRRGPRHPATKVFQALRVAVNDELGSLKEGLEGFVPFLAGGGRMAVITFHSLEDRIVKRFFKERSTPEIDRPEWPQARPNPLYSFRLITSSPVAASAAEVSKNPRSRSAKLRVAEKLPRKP